MQSRYSVEVAFVVAVDDLKMLVGLVSDNGLGTLVDGNGLVDGHVWNDLWRGVAMIIIGRGITGDA